MKYEGLLVCIAVMRNNFPTNQFQLPVAALYISSLKNNNQSFKRKNMFACTKKIKWIDMWHCAVSAAFDWEKPSRSGAAGFELY